MKILSVEDVAELIRRHGFENYIFDLMQMLKADFKRWDEFKKIPRIAMHVPGGVLELMPISDDTYYSTDPGAMDKFERNMHSGLAKLVRCANTEGAVSGADIITTCTACKAHVDVIKNDRIKPGVHINGIGGDCPGKTELELAILLRSRIVVEYFEQTLAEGEIQRFTKEQANEEVYAELHELVSGKKIGRASDQEITLYDSVGIALEDFSVLKMTYELAERYNLGEAKSLIPLLKDPKNLIAKLA